MKFNYSFSTKLRVRYGETDQMGYCYYGNYAQYFEIGRVETLRNCGLSYKVLENQGIMLPVSEYSVKYLAPAYYDDELTIKTTITEISGARIYFYYDIVNSNNKLISTAQTILVFVNKADMRPIQAPDSFIQLFDKYKIQ